MPDSPPPPVIQAPKIPSVSPDALIAKFMEWYHGEGWKLWLALGICILVAICAAYLIYDHYMKYPIKVRKLRTGRFKLSNFIKLKKR